MNDMRELLQRFAVGMDGAVDPKIPVVGQIAVLKETLELYRRPCPFKVGDFVTPRKNSEWSGHGVPHIVADLIETPRLFLGGDSGSKKLGVKPDIRVLRITDGGDVVALCAESWHFEPWSDQDEKAAGSIQSSDDPDIDGPTPWSSWA